ncbi:MAG: PD40 domain-containing protein [Pleurocapsa minor GSE-CHR-MK-17-07R]|nr:PD40 domain-containing protein [Pleurocapsa minor GSE-CHR-MK 17-07R]
MILTLMMMLVVGAQAQESTPPAPESTEAATPVSTDTAAPTASPEPTTSPEPTASPEVTVEVTETAAPTETPSAVPTDAPTSTPEIVVTITEPTQAATPETTPESTPEERPTQPAEGGDAGGPITNDFQTFCLMDIDDAGDENPYTYGFSAIQSYNIASWNWDFGDASIPDAPVQNPGTVTFPGTGSYTITLTCTPSSGAPFNLTGSISISESPVAQFAITPTNIYVGALPYTITTVNSSTGATDYAWKISASGNPADAGFYTASTTDISYTFTATDLTNAGFNAAGPATFWIHLLANNGSNTASASQGLTISPLPPLATFTLTPISGPSPLNVTVEGVDRGNGPITSWSWDFGDGSPLVTGIGPHNHTYTVGSGSQTFTITLSYSGPGGSGSVSRQVGVYPPSTPVVAAYTFVNNGNVGSDVQYCFTNNSTGPVAISEWDWNGDGTYDETNNDAVVCHNFSTAGIQTVRLQVTNSTGTSTSTASNFVNVQFAPVAAFTFTPSSPLNFGTAISFDSTSSTGVITSWAWDFNNDGTTDSTDENPTGIQLSTIGNNIVRLTVTGPGGSSFVEGTIVVNQVDLTCAYSGLLQVDPSVGGSQTYTSTIGNALGRTVTYAWSVTGTGTGLPISASTANLSVNWGTVGEGSFLVTLEATTANGARCIETKTVNVTYPALDCQMTNNVPSPLYAGTGTYTFTANVSNVSNRTVTGYTWYVDNVEQVGQTSSTFTRQYLDNPLTATTEVVSYTVAVQDSQSRVTNCSEDVSITLTPFPAPTCNISVSAIPSPLYPTGATYNLVASYGSVFGRTQNAFTWTASYGGGTATGTLGETLPWTATNDSVNHPDATITVNGSLTDNNGTTTPCSQTIDLTVSAWPTLTCNAISGLATPQPRTPDNTTRSSNYSTSVNGAAGRTITYSWTVPNAASLTGSGSSRTISWNSAYAELATATANDNISYTASLTNPDGTTDSCTRNRNVAVTWNRLTCAAPTGDLTPVVGESESYASSVGQQYSRSISYAWLLEQEISPGNYSTTATGTSASFLHQFLIDGANYRLSYTATAAPAGTGDYAIVGDSCTSAYTNLVGTGAGESFFCDAGPTLVGGPISSSSANYSFNMTIDNGNALPLMLEYWLLRPGSVETLLTTVNSSANGVISSGNILGSALGPDGVGPYTLRVDVSSASSTYTCAPTLALAVGSISSSYTDTYVGGGAIDRTRVEVETPICFTNTSTFSHLSTEDYLWTITPGTNNSLGVGSFTTENPSDCFSFDAPGTYTVSLRARNSGNAGSTDSNFSRTYTVYGHQALLINRSAEVFAGSTISFQGIATNLTGPYNWTFYNIDNPASPVSIGTRNNQQNTTFFFANPGRYRAVVTGVGPLRTETAMLEFTLLAAGSLQSSFSPSQWDGLDPMEVCFTDTSIYPYSGDPAEYSWDFNNDGTPDLTYSVTSAGDRQTPCRTFTGVGQTFPVRLSITKGSLVDTSTNTVRTLTLLESNADFTISPVTASNFCFNALLTGGLSVVGWDYFRVENFPSGAPEGTSGAVNSPCYTFGAVGSYVVRLRVTDGTTDGSVTRTVVVTPSSGTAPSLSVNGSCTAARTASFIVSNTGGAMTISDSVRISVGGTVIYNGSLLLAGGQSATYSVANVSGGVVTFTSRDTALTATTTCNYPPEASATVVCQAYYPAFTVSLARTDGPMLAAQNYTIEDAGGNTVSTGTFFLDAGNMDDTFAVPAGNDPYASYTFVTSGAAGSFGIASSSSTCAAPNLSVSGTCSADRTVTFTVTNTGGLMFTSDNVTISAGGTDVFSGTMQIGGGGSADFTASNVSGVVTFTSGTTSLSTTTTCNYPPQASAEVACVNFLPSFNLSLARVDGPMLAPQAYTITDENSNTVSTGTFFMDASTMTTTVSVPSGTFPYAPYTFTTTGEAGAITLSTLGSTCLPPALSAAAVCSADTVSFTITNAGGPMSSAQNIFIIGNDAQNYTPASNSFTLGLYGSTSFSIARPETANTFGLYTTGGAANLNASVTINCDDPNDTTGFDPSFVAEVLGSALAATLAPNGSRFGGITGEAAAAPTCGGNCPPFELYHTNETGDWEIFRLDSSDEETRTDDHRNLTFGENSRDVAPSLSPNYEWVAFASDRDGNWELYVASTDGDPASVRRITFNEFANDNNPAWGPNNYLVYETNRFGNWDLVLIDLMTGAETPLTRDLGDNTNASWSPDGQSIVFQSNRANRFGEAKWQIYRMNVFTRETTQVSNGFTVDTNPIYANESNQLVYDTYGALDTSTGGINTSGIPQLAIMDDTGNNNRILTSASDNAEGPSWSPSDRYLAYSVNMNGLSQVQVYDVGTGEKIQITDNAVANFAPTWKCSDDVIVFVSNIDGDPNIHEVEISMAADGPIDVQEDATQRTFDPGSDVYPSGGNLPEGNAERTIGAINLSSQQDTGETETDSNVEDWISIDGCAGLDGA